MFDGYFLNKVSAQYEDRLLIIDTINLQAKVDYMSILKKNGFDLVLYQNDLQLRLDLECRKAAEKIAIIAHPMDYIPYDIRQRFFCFELKLESLFTRLNAEAIINFPGLNYDLLTMAYEDDFDDHYEVDQTIDFIKEKAYNRDKINRFIDII